MQIEYCLVYRKRGSSDDYAAAPYTIGWTQEECEKQLPKYRDIAYDDEWEIGMREVSPWRLLGQKPEVKEQQLPGLEIVKGDVE